MLLKKVVIKENKLSWWKKLLVKFGIIRDDRKFKYYTPVNSTRYVVILNPDYYEFSGESSRRVFFGVYDKISNKVYSVSSIVPRVVNVRYILSTAKMILGR